MLKKITIFLITSVSLLSLAACASLNIPGVSAQSNQNNQANRGGFNADPSKMPVEQKLAIGILKLEGTNQAVTAQQAKDLLPLWKAVKSLDSSSTTSPQEIQGLYKQIQDTLTPEQVQAIQKMTWNQQDLRAMMQQYGVQFPQGGSASGRPTLDPSQRATRVAQFQAQNGGSGNRRNNGGGGGGFGGGNFGGGGFSGGGNGGFNGQPGGTNIQRTPAPGQNQGRRFGGGLNALLANPVIKLLEQRAGA